MIDINANGLEISAVLLFGSRARGDSSRGSDTDLLLISPPGTPRHKSSGHLSMFFYPWRKLVADAQDGDLFVCHLTLEAKPVFDPTERLDKLRSTFILKSSYRHEIVQALEVGSLINQFAEQLSPDVVARRILWCVRTILIARSAERGEPVFAPARLAATTSSAAAADLLVGRHQRKVDATMRQRFRRFLAEEVNELTACSCGSLDEYERWFERTGNVIGLQTLRSKRGTDGSYT